MARPARLRDGDRALGLHAPAAATATSTATATTAEFGFHGTFHTVRDNDLAIQTFEFEGAPDEVAIEFMRFVDLGDGRCRLEGRSIGRTVEGRDRWSRAAWRQGMAEGYERLDELVAASATA